MMKMKFLEAYETFIEGSTLGPGEGRGLGSRGFPSRIGPSSAKRSLEAPGHDDPFHVFSQRSPSDAEVEREMGKLNVDPAARTGIQQRQSSGLSKTDVQQQGPIEAGEFRSFIQDLGDRLDQMSHDFGNRFSDIERRLDKAGV